MDLIDFRIGYAIVTKANFPITLGQVVMVGEETIFHIASSFLEFVKDYALSLTKNKFSIQKLPNEIEYISAYANYGLSFSQGPQSEAGISVSVSSVPFLGPLGSGFTHPISYSYQVTISYVVLDPEQIWTLTTRSWKITYQGGKIENVNGYYYD